MLGHGIPWLPIDSAGHSVQHELVTARLRVDHDSGHDTLDIPRKQKLARSESKGGGPRIGEFIDSCHSIQGF